MKNFKHIEDEYLYNNCTKEEFDEYYKYDAVDFSDDIKKIIIHYLDPVETRIILIYAEFGNMRETAKTLGVSLGTIYKKIKIIQNKIKTYL